MTGGGEERRKVRDKQQKEQKDKRKGFTSPPPILLFSFALDLWSLIVDLGFLARARRVGIARRRILHVHHFPALHFAVLDAVGEVDDHADDEPYEGADPRLA